MGLSNGAVTCRTYHTAEELPADFLSRVEKDLRQRAFRPVNPEQAPTSMGWVNARNVLDTDLRLEKVQYEDFLVIGLRLDKITLNNQLLKAHFAQRMEKILKEQGRKQMSRDEKSSLLDDVRLELMKKQTPSTALYEMAWNLQSNCVYFSNTGKKVNTEFCDLFQETFHVGLMPLFPYLRAELRCEREGTMDDLVRVEPAIFSPLGR